MLERNRRHYKSSHDSAILAELTYTWATFYAFYRKSQRNTKLRFKNLQTFPNSQNPHKIMNRIASKSQKIDLHKKILRCSWFILRRVYTE